jgi:hypothetical protein
LAVLCSEVGHLRDKYVVTKEEEEIKVMKIIKKEERE